MIPAALALYRRRQKIERLFSIAGSSDPLNQAPLSQFLCIQASGYIEQTLKDAVSEFASLHSRPEVSGFVAARIRRFRNFNCAQLIQIVGDHSIEWAERLDVYLTPRLRLAIDSIYNNRNQIAHGNDVGIGLAQIRGYYDDAGKVLDYVFSDLLNLGAS